MTHHACRYSRDAGDYLNPDGQPCIVDEYGDPTHHCTARTSCSVHIGRGEQTCPRCIARARADLRRIPVLAAFVQPVAIVSGIDSAAADLAAGAADPRAWTERQIAMRSHLDTWATHGRITDEQRLHARQGMAESDDRHPLNILGRWELMLRDEYDHPTHRRIYVATAADYLDQQLARLAQDPDQDFGQFATEMRKCRRHLETVTSLALERERGAPCPDCTSDDAGLGPRLVRHYAHWCDDPDCDRIHYDDDRADVWICPRNPAHRWDHADYERWIEERKGA